MFAVEIFQPRIYHHSYHHEHNRRNWIELCKFNFFISHFPDDIKIKFALKKLSNWFWWLILGLVLIRWKIYFNFFNSSYNNNTKKSNWIFFSIFIEIINLIRQYSLWYKFHFSIFSLFCCHSDGTRIFKDISLMS